MYITENINICTQSYMHDVVWIHATQNAYRLSIHAMVIGKST